MTLGTGVRRRRVLWLVKGLGPGGAERLLVSAAATHDRDAFSIEVAYLLPWKDALVPELETLGVPTHCLDVGNERDLRWVTRLRARLAAEPVDVLHSHSPYPAGFARVAARTLPTSRRPATVFTTHNTWTSFALPSRVLNGVTFPLDAADVAVSRQVLATMWPRARRRTEVLVHGVPLAAVRSHLEARAATRAELGIGPDEVIAGTIANFRAQKDWPNLLTAAAILRDRDVPVRIVAVGQGPLEAETRALHARLRLGDRVLLLGRRDDAVRVLAACDLFVLASSNEGLPVALMEALALGLPVVATDVGGVPEAVTDGVEGRLVPPRRADLLAAGIEQFAVDPAARAAHARRARATGDRFDIRRAAARIEQIYREVSPR